MKFVAALFAALAVSTTNGKWTCSDCDSVVDQMARYLTSDESVANQVEILLAEVCPQVDEADACVEGLPGFWKSIAAVLWPGYYDSSAEWMCKPLCDPEVR